MNHIIEKMKQEMKQREDQLYHELCACSISELTGIVGPIGLGRSRIGDEGLWSLYLPLNAWRISSKRIQTKPLGLRRRVSLEEYDMWQASIQTETVIRFRARVAESNCFGSPQAQLEELIESSGSEDSEMQSYLIELQDGVTHEDERFGTLTLDGAMNWYSGSVVWQGLNIKLDVEQPLVSALEVAYALWDNESSWHKRVCDYTVESLLPLKNDNWLGDNEAELSAEQFIKKMSLRSISVKADGNFEFWHDDGGLFFGHSINVSGNLSTGLSSANIPG